MRTMTSIVCKVCGSGHEVPISEMNRGRGKTCSHSCAASLAAANRNSKGKSNNNWKGDDVSQNTIKTRQYRKKHPERLIAYIAVKKAIRHGDLVQMPCEKCGNTKSVAHHCDYSKPLDVMWLCPKHHMEWHKNNPWPAHITK